MPALARNTNKKASKRQDADVVWHNADWRVIDGQLRRGPGHPGTIQPLFETIAEKLPFESLASVQRSMRESGLRTVGVYLAHDSMGCVRYAGRGNIFPRLRARYRAQTHELVYYSFYVVKERMHEREIETVLIRAAGPLLAFNDRKKRTGIEPGSVRDYEPGTFYYRRIEATVRSAGESG